MRSYAAEWRYLFARRHHDNCSWAYSKMKQRYLKLVRSARRLLRHKQLRHHEWWQRLTRPLLERRLWLPCRDTVANGLAIGLFFSMMPMPFQMLVAAILAMRFRVNIPSAVAACWISNPLTQMPIFVAQHRLGAWLSECSNMPMPAFLSRVSLHPPGVGEINAGNFLLGVMASGVILAVLSYPIVYCLARLFPLHLPVARVRSKPAEGHLSHTARLRP